METILRCAMDIGEHMLVCGGEVYRVEESIRRICLAYGAKRTDVFIITSSMVVTIFTEDGKNYTQTRRIRGSETNIESLHKLNDLSRQICRGKVSVQEADDICNRIKACKKYPFWMECLSYGVIAASFALFFGGGIRDAVVAPVIGVILRMLLVATDRLVPNRIFEKFICSAMTTLLAYMAVRAQIIVDVDKVIIGNIMALIPGIGLTNSLRDLFVGDSITGLLRFIEACLLALAIGAGYFLVVCLMGGVS